MTTETAAAIAGDTLYFRVDERKHSYKVLQFKVPPGSSIEETAAALKKALHDPGAWVMTGDVICGATLIDVENGEYLPDDHYPRFLEILEVTQVDADGEDIEGES